ncbi:MAG: hypothetical protein ACOC9R_02490 [bacterium]
MAEQTLAYGRAELDRTRLADDEDAPLTFVASTTQTNRFGYSLRTDGWRVDNFNANPVLLWMHNPFRPPIGTGRAAARDGKLLLEQVRFDRGDEVAVLVEQKYRGGFLYAVSVGFSFQTADGNPVRRFPESDEEIRDELFYELEEVSSVTVPADPGALVAQSRAALARLSDELAGLADEKQHGAVSASELRRAVHAELARLGIDPNSLGTTGDPGGDPPPAGVPEEAARALRGAFDLEVLQS